MVRFLMVLLIVLPLALAAPMVQSAATDDHALIQLGLSSAGLADDKFEEGSSAAAMMDLAKSANTMVDRVSGMVGDGLYKDTSQDTQKEIDFIVKAIEEHLEAAIRADHQNAQDQIDNALKDLVATTGSTVDLKVIGDQREKQLNECRDDEKAELAKYEKLDSNLKTLLAERTSDCADRMEHRSFKWELGGEVPTTGDCDFMTQLGSCDDFDKLQKRVGRLEKLMQDQRSVFREKSQNCKDTTEKLDRKMATDIEIDPSNPTGYAKRKNECDDRFTKMQVAMCQFGDRLQEKCNAKLKLEQARKTVLEGSTTELSRADRIQLWESTQRIKCWFKSYREGGLFQAGTNSNCGDAISYDDSIGKIALREDESAVQMGEDKFTCNEKQVAFTGQQWVIGEKSSDYVLSNYTPAIIVEPLGSRPFNFCAGAQACEIGPDNKVCRNGGRSSGVHPDCFCKCADGFGGFHCELLLSEAPAGAPADVREAAAKNLKAVAQSTPATLSQMASTSLPAAPLAPSFLQISSLASTDVNQLQEADAELSLVKLQLKEAVDTTDYLKAATLKARIQQLEEVKSDRHLVLDGIKHMLYHIKIAADSGNVDQVLALSEKLRKLQGQRQH